MRITQLFIFFLIVQSTSAQIYIPKFDVQGHRGCRGLKPENSIPAFIAALDSGVTTIEMDVAITKDGQIIVSHEPWMSAAICQNPTGKAFTAKQEMRYNIFQMTYDEVKRWDCGSKGNERFPEQEKISMHKPLLRDVILAVENHVKNYTKYEVDYNIEIKSLPEGDGKFHPKPEEFSDIVYAMIDQYLPMERVVLQSFDFRILKYLHKKYPEVRLAALVENLKAIDENLKDLGFIPSIYSPDYKLLDKQEVKHCHELKMRVIPWTVNDPAEMIALKGMGVDGFITDYPDRARKIRMTLALKPKDVK
ncbi:glycerophosphodiester phosphodiesterase family protein [soil metagenome]